MSCGPVAILNVRKWLGKKHTAYRENLHHFESMGFCYETGMEPRSLSKTLNKMKIKYKRKSLAAIEDIEEAIDNDNLVILQFAWYCKKDGFHGAHYVVIDKHTDKSFKAWNYSWEIKGPWIKKSEFKKDFLYTRRYYNRMYDRTSPIIWIINKD